MRTRTILKALYLPALFAICVTQVSAACLKPPATAEAINQFRSNPQALVAPNADTRTIEATTRDLAGTDASLAADLIRVAEEAAPRFRTAIAAGLAQAALACENVDQQAAQVIQQAVAGFQDGQFQASFAAVAGDLSTAATAAATASATSSAGSVVIVNPNTSPRSTTARGGGGGAVTALAITASGFVASPAATPTTTSTTAANPVSATR
jgi:hypothetical protein